MSKTKQTKRALLASALSVLLCVSMLIGTTFAWFTDYASVNVNSIRSGILDIELQMKNDAGEWVDAEGQTLSFVKATGAEDETILWEPGCTYNLQELRLLNHSNLALKYKVVVTGIQGDAVLNEAIDWTITLGGETLSLDTDLVWLPGDGTAEDAKVFTISGHMRETAGNEYQDLTIDGIGITVLATQYTYEHDSIDDQYDADAKYATPVSTPAAFAAALANGEDVILTQPIELPEAIEVTGDVTIYGGENGSLSIADGDNARVININDQTAPLTLTLSGVDVVGPTSGTYTRGISVYGNTDVTIVADNCSISANYYALNIASNNDNVHAVIKNTTLTGWCAAQTHSANSNVTFENCTLIGNNDKAYNADGWNNFATVVINQTAAGSVWTFNNCTIEANATTGNRQYLLSLRAACTVNINNCTFKVDGVEVDADDAPISVSTTGITINIDGDTVFSN